MKKKLIKNIAFQDDTIAIESLPLPRVLYPGFYGAFFGFQAKADSPIFMCLCSKEAIENYIKFRTTRQFPINDNPYRKFILDSMYFPKSLITQLINLEIEKSSDIINYIDFKQGICHECNGKVPHFRYCHEMYGGAFKQTYGWYINKQAYEFGIEPITNMVIPEIAPDYILEIIKIDPIVAAQEYLKIKPVDPNAAEEMHKTLLHQNRILWNFIEDEVRLKFGHKKVGESWISETVLYSIARSLYPCHSVLRHYRPKFLKGLELDVFIEDLKIGLEYQGIQHFQPIKHWGDVEAFEKLKERDNLKRKLCKKNNITLVYFNYNEGLNAENVSIRIQNSIKQQRG